ncbi:hypothetical protein [Paenibacillus algorifonticola]|nr:hypothetical protein [Paenibacillus algorifonticola]
MAKQFQSTHPIRSATAKMPMNDAKQAFIRHIFKKSNAKKV